MSVIRRLAPFAIALTFAGSAGTATIVTAGENEHEAKAGQHDKSHVQRQKWSFGGLTGRFDKKQLRRGFQIYNEVCAACHSMKLMYYRNLMEPGGPEFSKKEVEAIIADKEVPAPPNDDGATINDDGERIMRKALLTDHFVSPYANDKAAMSANGGALPPDLSVMAKARGIPHGAKPLQAGNIFSAAFEGVKEYVGWIFGTVYNLATQYQEAGPDYIHALMIGYEEEAPKGMEIPEGKSFNWVFPGHAISMPQPLSDEQVEYADGTKATLDQEARDIAAFLMWTADPHLNARKSLGLKVLIYLIILSILMYAVKRTIWAGVKH